MAPCTRSQSLREQKSPVKTVHYLEVVHEVHDLIQNVFPALRVRLSEITALQKNLDDGIKNNKNASSDFRYYLHRKKVELLQHLRSVNPILERAQSSLTVITDYMDSERSKGFTSAFQAEALAVTTEYNAHVRTVFMGYIDYIGN